MHVASASAAPLVLLALAWRRDGIEPAVRRDTGVLHGIKDDEVPLADRVGLERRNSLPPENLVPVKDDHHVASPLAMAALLLAVARAASHPSHEGTPRHSQIKTIRPSPRLPPDRRPRIKEGLFWSRTMQERVKVFTFVSGHGETVLNPPHEEHINQWLSAARGKLVRVTQSESERPGVGHHVTVCLRYLPEGASASP
jgi:hypothetical protein